jgi:phospholipid-translocating ATPase
MAAIKFVNAQLKQDVESPRDENHMRQLYGFFSTLALCHTVLAGTDEQTGRLEYKAQSPDEAALVQAAADAGFIFLGREREIMRMQTPFAGVEEFELLNVLDFTSARKRMSVIVRKMDPEDRRVFLMCKGADNVIFDRLKSGNDSLRQKTGEDLDYFASEGALDSYFSFSVLIILDRSPYSVFGLQDHLARRIRGLEYPLPGSPSRFGKPRGKDRSCFRSDRARPAAVGCHCH